MMYQWLKNRFFMKILLTGGSGMVGRNLQDYARIKRQDEIIAPSSKDLNLLDYDNVLEYVKQTKPDLIIHAAGVVGGIQANINNPVKFLVDNMTMGMNIINAAKEAKINKLLNLGSATMYPKLATQPISEEMILTGLLDPANEGYALSKIVLARLCQYCNKESDGDSSFKTLIPCNLYGKYDTFNGVKSHMIPAAIFKVHQAKLNDDQAVEIWGDGTARREFMFSEDLASAVFFCLDRFDELPDMLNIGLGHDFSVNEYYQAVAEVVEYQASFKHDISKPVGTKKRLLDNTKLEELGWKPTYTLKDGLQKTYEYYLENN